MLDDAGVENKKIAAERFKDWKDAEKAEAQATIARDQARKAVSLLDNARQSAEAWQQEAARNQVTTSIATTQAALSNNSASQAQSQANAAYAQMNAAAQQAYQQGVNEGRQRCQAAYQEGYQQGFTNGRSNSYNHVDVRGTINVQQRPGVWIGQ
jgi:flagellar biosynthesis/type III secretory pathway protein FliH